MNLETAVVLGRSDSNMATRSETKAELNLRTPNFSATFDVVLIDFS